MKKCSHKIEKTFSKKKNSWSFSRLWHNEPIFESAWVSSKILHVSLYLDRDAHKLGGGPGVGKYPTLGPSKMCRPPLPGLTTRANAPLLTGGTWNWLMHKAWHWRAINFVTFFFHIGRFHIVNFTILARIISYLVTLLKMQPHYSQSSPENAILFSGTCPCSTHMLLPTEIRQVTSVKDFKVKISRHSFT